MLLLLCYMYDNVRAAFGVHDGAQVRLHIFRWTIHLGTSERQALWEEEEEEAACSPGLLLQ